MNPRRFNKSVEDAFHGVKFVFKHERNFKIQIFFAMLVCLAGYFIGLRPHEWIVIIMLVMFVLILELLNTAIEKFSDIIKPRMHHFVEVIKDIMAAAVLIASAGSVVIGAIIFIPKLVEYLK